ncbi:dnaJ homolog subfamily C member 8 isoform X2 [Callorhinchus milii]|uniref:dnaJ homolog subfamily C member 8 isoform X2 n=1 Tax=Callorhinchus milii TaxID=7868 RepID=UPI001C3FB8E8|nr:dnaJ homolog subfamily C member 8 isoform X2 [Callorhinchus milii]
MASSSGAAQEKEKDPGGEEAFKVFLTEVKQIEKRDSVLTPIQQIERLTRPGSSYINLNPFEVLQIDPEATDEELKKRFRQLSILVHPDKNQDDPERAQKAFEAVDKAYKMLLEGDQKKRAIDVIQAARETIEHNMKEKRKLLKKEGKPILVEEDDEDVVREGEVYVQTICTQTNNEAVCRAGNQEEGAGSQRDAREETTKRRGDRSRRKSQTG